MTSDEEKRRYAQCKRRGDERKGRKGGGAKRRDGAEGRAAERIGIDRSGEGKGAKSREGKRGRGAYLLQVGTHTLYQIKINLV